MSCALHPDRAAVQPCERCGTFSCAECLRFVGSQKQCPPCRARLSELEWDRRADLGMLRAWWLTTKRVTLSPLQTFDSVTPDASVFESMLYAFLSSVAGLLPTMVVTALFGALGVGTTPKAVLAEGIGVGIGIFALYLVLLVVMSLAMVLGIAGLEVLILKLAGVRTASYPVAVRAHALSTAAYVAGVIPICSLYLYPLWAVILRIFAIERLQKTTTGAAVASALIPLGLCCMLCGGFYALVIAATTAVAK